MFQSKDLRQDFTTSLDESFKQLLLKPPQFAKHIFTSDCKTANQRVIHHSSTTQCLHQWPTNLSQKNGILVLWKNAKDQHLLYSQITTSKPDNGTSINLWLVELYGTEHLVKIDCNTDEFNSLKTWNRQLRTILCQIPDLKPSLPFTYQYKWNALTKICQTWTWRQNAQHRSQI